MSYIDPRLEVVNMGQGGYGIEQDYLWYMRDGIKLEHRIHIVAIISDDFLRFGNRNSELRAFLDSELSKRNIMFLDLVDDFNKIPISEMDGLFIRRSRFLGGMGHYTVKGNEYVSRIIYKKLSFFLSAGRSESL